jgi:hypothetical protein
MWGMGCRSREREWTTALAVESCHSFPLDVDRGAPIIAVPVEAINCRVRSKADGRLPRTRCTIFHCAKCPDSAILIPKHRESGKAGSETNATRPAPNRTQGG